MEKLLTVKEWEIQDSASTNWDVAIVDDEAKCVIKYSDKKKSNFRRRMKDCIARAG